MYCFILGPPVIVTKYITSDYITVLTAEFYSNPEPSCVQWYFFAELIINCNLTENNVIQRSVNLVMYGQNVLAEGYVTNLTSENLTNGKYIVIIENAFGKIKEEFEVFKTGNNILNE